MAKKTERQQLKRVAALVRQAQVGATSKMAFDDMVEQARQSDISRVGRVPKQPAWYNLFGMFRSPCEALSCDGLGHTTSNSQDAGIFFAVLLGVISIFYFFLAKASGGQLIAAASGLLVSMRWFTYCFFAENWKDHAKELKEKCDLLLRRRGAGFLQDYLLKEINSVERMIVGDQTVLFQVRDELQRRLKKSRELAAKLEMGARSVSHATIREALAAGHLEAQTLVEQRVQNLERVQMHIARLEAFFRQLRDECRAMPFEALALLEELREERDALQKEIALVEEVIASSVAQLEARMSRLETTFSTSLPRAVARLTAAGEADFDQELRLLDSTLDQVAGLVAIAAKPTQAAQAEV